MSGLLEARDVSVVFGGGFGRREKRAVDGISFGIGGERPRIVAIVGESGSGKTTLTRLLLGFQRPTAGSVRYRGTNLEAMNSREYRGFRKDVQAIFQDPFDVYNPFYKIDRVLLKPLLAFGLATDRADADRRIAEALSRVGLRPAETLGRYPHQLSGGQRQRIMIARALLLKPRIILADEPVSMVDASLRATILESLHRLKTELGISLVYVTHDLTTAYQIADEVVVLYGGRIVEAGDAEAVIRQPEHPYTRALVDAIPPPDPLLPWGRAEAAPRAGDGPAIADRGCAFANRCPEALDLCRTAVPPLVETGAGRRTACHRRQPVAAPAPAPDPEPLGATP
ncbi:ABC transporter ATP-binding protein [Prosthecomicrobium sp. N25]|uniref:ABC transporter ATP-binding protein n=1 Tax=Prosthecomicrobium sp. N25 TaxID=3129254 RepID=UPI00307743C6